MKKIMILTMALLCTALLVGCIIITQPPVDKDPVVESPAVDEAPVVEETPEVEETPVVEETEAPVGFEGSLSELVSAIYEKVPTQFPVGEAMEIDINDPDTLKYYLGLESKDGVKEAVFSEAMIGSQAYSMCVLRLEEGADAAFIADEIFNKVDAAKWICVCADKMNVTVLGDLVHFVMAGSSLSETLAAEMSAAFLEVCGVENADLALVK